MKKLIKKIKGTDCVIYAIRHHNREKVATASPIIEVYEDAVKFPVLGEGVVSKRYYFSIVLCVGKELTEEAAEGLMCFELSMYLPRAKDGVFEKVDFCAVTLGNIEPEMWEFTIEDKESVKMIMGKYE